VYCLVVWQHAIGVVCVLCGGVAACHRYGVCTFRCVKCIFWCVNFIDIRMHGTTVKNIIYSWCWFK